MKNCFILVVLTCIAMVGDCYGGGFVKRDRPVEITLSDMKGLIETFSGIVGKKLGDAANALNARIELQKGWNRYNMELNEGVISSGGAIFSLIEGIELTTDETVDWVFIHMNDSDGRLALLTYKFGPGRLDIVSPPLAGEAPNWKPRYSICHIINHREVCFSITEYEEGERLESISISKGDD